MATRPRAFKALAHIDCALLFVTAWLHGGMMSGEDTEFIISCIGLTALRSEARRQVSLTAVHVKVEVFFANLA